MSMPTVLVRCDGTAATGLGHASRALALAEALEDAGARAHFLGHFEAPSEARLQAAGFAWTALGAEAWTDADACETATRASALSACGVIVDTYLATASYLAHLERAAAPTMLVDDFANLDAYPCSVLLNFTARGQELGYPVGGARYLLGPRWFLARRPLRRLRARGATAVRERVGRVLVTAGGDARSDVVMPLVETLARLDRGLSVRVVVRGTHPRERELKERLASFRESTLASDLPDLAGELAQTDLCLSAAGLTRYEAAFCGVPAGVLPQNAGQAADTAIFARRGLTFDLGPAWDIDPCRLERDVARLLGEPQLRRSIQERALVEFPRDPTADVARLALTEVFRGG